MNTLNFIYWLSNFNQPIKTTFVHLYGENLGSHFYSKLITYNGDRASLTPGAIVKTILEMTTDHQIALLEWVEVNYKSGVTA